MDICPIAHIHRGLPKVEGTHLMMESVSPTPFHYKQRRLENDRLALEPFDPPIHVCPFVEEMKTSPDICTYIYFPAFETEKDFMTEFYDKYISSSAAECFYAILDKVHPSAAESRNCNYAGVMSLTCTNPENAAAEIGVMIFPRFQRTHVSTNAIGLLLRWMLDPPSAGGLGLRRVEWRTHAANIASRKAALRMGFEFEGILRWERVFPGGRIALPVDALEKRNETTREPPGRHTAVYSIVWDEWDNKRTRIVSLMARTV